MRLSENVMNNYINDLNKLLKDEHKEKIICLLSSKFIKTPAVTIKDISNIFEMTSLTKYIEKYNKHPISEEKCHISEIVEGVR